MTLIDLITEASKQTADAGLPIREALTLELETPDGLPITRASLIHGKLVLSDTEAERES